MRHLFSRHLVTIFIILVLASLACSSLTPASEPETSYRYDSLPDTGDENETAAKFSAISQWGKTNITYYFINGTGKINGDTERDLIRAAFALWADETSLTFNEVD